MHRDELLFQVDAPVLGAVAQARLARRRRGGAADRGGRPAGRAPAARPLARCASASSSRQLDMLERMSPWEYQEIRKVLGHGSGFDSPGWSELRASSRARAGASTRPGATPACRSPTSTCAGREHEELYRSPRRCIELDEQRAALAHAPLPGRGTRDRRQGRRHAGDARRAARRLVRRRRSRSSGRSATS